ncbi:MAG: TetR/AcrR family transcriptional regulator [Deltaproteobacteria bacterium]|nr:TetR/AcrR family transcriptional regulator [Deltaproteobacteria bacterium]
MQKTIGVRPNPVKETREKQIKDAALKLFSEKGFHNTTMAEIALAAGLGKGTLYWYWKSKEALAFSLVSDMLSAFLDLIEETRDCEGNIIKRLEKLAQRVADLYQQKKEYCRLLLKFRADRHYTFNPDYIEQVMKYYVRMRSAIASIIEQGIKAGEFKKVDSQFIAFIILGIVEGLELEWLENEKEFSMHKGLKTVLYFAKMGLQKQKK